MFLWSLLTDFEYPVYWSESESESKLTPTYTVYQEFFAWDYY